jgi:uncharacterized protein
LRYGILPEGNAPFDPHNEFTGKNLLYTARGIADIAREIGSRARRRRRSADARAHHAASGPRDTTRPHLDDKVLTGWNGLMIARVSRARRACSPAARRWARRYGGGSGSAPPRVRAAAAFVKRRDVEPERGRAVAAISDTGDAAIEAYAEDYASLVFGLLELFQADGDPSGSSGRSRLQARRTAVLGCGRRRLVQHDRRTTRRCWSA